MTARRIHRANRRTIDRNAVEDRQQAADAEIVADQERREPGDTKSRQRRVAQGLGVGRAKAAADRDRANLAVDIEAPVDRTPAVNEREAAVIVQPVDILRNAVALQISRRSAGDEAMRRQQSCHRAAVVAATEPDGEIDAFIDQVDIAIVERDAYR